MRSRHKDDPEDETSRSYCVFERDRDLPRPTPWRPLTAEAAPPSRFARVVAIGIGVALFSVVTAWWFIVRAG